MKSDGLYQQTVLRSRLRVGRHMAGPRCTLLQSHGMGSGESGCETRPQACLNVQGCEAQDKWGNEEAPYVDWEEVGKVRIRDTIFRLSRLLGLLGGRQAFKVWKDLGMGAPIEYLQGTFAILSEVLPVASELFSDRLSKQVASSKLPAKGGLHLSCRLMRFVVSTGSLRSLMQLSARKTAEWIEGMPWTIGVKRFSYQ